jgi:hypothetical protein
MPHRDPLAAIWSRCEQLERRLAERGHGELPIEARRALARAARTQSLRDALDAQHALEEQLRALRVHEEAESGDADDVPPGLVAEGPPIDEPRPSARRLVAFPAFSAAAALTAWFLAAPSSAPAGPRPKEPFRSEFAAVVVSTSGAIQASPSDRCIVKVDAEPGRSGPDRCVVAVTCPGIERRLDVPCEVPLEDEPFVLRDPVLTVDGAKGVLTLVDREGETERGRAELTIAAWR